MSTERSRLDLSKKKLKNLAVLKQIIKRLKNKGKKIVFTNGCFDILHLGHIRLLQEAKKYGDILIVGLNTDSSINKIKGNKRPIQSEKERSEILSAIQYVDYVILFDEDTPYHLINELKPDVLVKGGDYKGKEVVGRELVKEVKITAFLKGKSTTSIIEDILQKYGGDIISK